MIIIILMKIKGIISKMKIKLTKKKKLQKIIKKKKKKIMYKIIVVMKKNGLSVIIKKRKLEVKQIWLRIEINEIKEKEKLLW